jgi:hypothetical protein
MCLARSNAHLEDERYSEYCTLSSASPSVELVLAPSPLRLRPRGSLAPQINSRFRYNIHARMC